jgi:hypothetical protein
MEPPHDNIQRRALLLSTLHLGVPPPDFVSTSQVISYPMRCHTMGVPCSIHGINETKYRILIGKPEVTRPLGRDV